MQGESSSPTPLAPLTSYPGAQRPDRYRRVDAGGYELAVYEWGDEAAPPVLACHGGMDFAATFDLIAPLVAAAGWRFVAWDQRGHGDSDRTELYSWDGDVRDAYHVLASSADAPCPVIGHSKGGGMMMQLAEAMPHRVSHVVNLDGLPCSRPQPDVTNHDRTRLVSAEVSNWLDYRRSAGGRERKPGSLVELATRRQKMNPRLPLEWLQYVAGIGAEEVEGGWRWKLDPVFRPGGFGPWRPEWSMFRLAGLAQPVLAVLGLEVEMMSWGTSPDDVRPYLPLGAKFVPLADTGHFVHIERPGVIADLIIEHIGVNA
jgi:pimeloyl-ACP methyl ester carboxylesterase